MPKTLSLAILYVMIAGPLAGTAVMFAVTAKVSVATVLIVNLLLASVVVILAATRHPRWLGGQATDESGRVSVSQRAANVLWILMITAAVVATVVTGDTYWAVWATGAVIGLLIGRGLRARQKPAPL